MNNLKSDVSYKPEVEITHIRDRMPDDQQLPRSFDRDVDKQWYALGVQVAQRVAKLRLLTNSDDEWNQFTYGITDTLMGRIDMDEQVKLLIQYENSLSSLVQNRSQSLNRPEEENVYAWDTSADVGRNELSDLEQENKKGPGVASSQCSEEDLAAIRLLVSSLSGPQASISSSQGAQSSTSRSTGTHGAYRVDPFDSANLAPPNNLEEESNCDASVTDSQKLSEPDIAVEATLIHASGDEEEGGKEEVIVATATRMTLLRHLREPKVCGLITFLVVAVIAISVSLTSTRGAFATDLSKEATEDDISFSPGEPCDVQEELISLLAPTLSEYDLTLDAPHSQAAIKWLSKDLAINPCLTFTISSSILQRYALAAVFFGSRTDDNPTASAFCEGRDRTGWPLSANDYESVCLWAGVYCQDDAVTGLDLSRRGWSGVIPRELVLFNSSLEYLDLSFNDYTGTIPSTFGRLTSLEKLYLSANALTGELPSSLGMLQKAVVILMEENRFSGIVPDSICDLNFEQLMVGCCASCECCSYCPDPNITPFAFK